MTEQITISSTYNCTVAGAVNLAPNTWNDVKDWFVKWDTLHVTFKDGVSKEFQIDSDLDSLESKVITDLRVSSFPVEETRQ